MTPFDTFVSDCRQEIDAALQRLAPAPPATPAIVADAMKYSLMAGGKRLRPLLTLAAADAVAGRLGVASDEARALALPAACAIEMIHTYSLIHDDLPAMDDDALRRGQPTLHVIAGDGMAILAGDGLQAAAFALLAREPQTADPQIASRKLRVLGIVADAAGPQGMVGGQAIDLAAVRPVPGQPPVPIDRTSLEDMHRRKTGALIRASAAAGATMAGADAALVAAIDRFAAEMGLAFQIVDDLLDVESGSETLGKTAGKDVAAGKPTYPALFGLDTSREMAKACLARAEAILEREHLQASHLGGLARRMVSRQS